MTYALDMTILLQNYICCNSYVTCNANMLVYNLISCLLATTAQDETTQVMMQTTQEKPDRYLDSP